MQGLFDDVGFAIVMTGVLAAGSTALVGSFLVVRGQALLTDAISHGIVLGIAVTFLLTGVTTGPLQLLGAGAAGVATVLLTEALSASGRVRRDAATGLVFPAMFALGVLLLSLFARDVHVDPHTVLLGEIGFVWLDRVTLLGLSLPRSLVVLAAMLVINVLFVAAFYERLSLAAFDEEQARIRGLRPRAVTIALLALTSMTAVAALDAVGVVLFVTFAIVPAVVGLLVARRLAGVVLVAMGTAAFAALAGYPVAALLDISIGGCMAAMTGIPLLLALTPLRRAWQMS